MFDLLKNILKFGFTVAAVLAANYILILGFREILRLVSGGMAGARRKKRKSGPGATLKKVVVNGVLFWPVFLCVVLIMARFIVQLLAILIAAAAIFRVAEKRNMAAGRVVMAAAALVTAVTALYVRSQPVLLSIEDQLSVDLWIYNAANSLLDAMTAAAMRAGMDTGGLERLAAMVPRVQENIFVFITISIYIFCGVTVGKLIKMILPDTKYAAPVYHMIPPEKYLLPLGALVSLYAWQSHVPQVCYIAAGVYYAWGVNLLIFALKGGWWPLNLFVLFCGAMHPVSIGIFICGGVLDNLFDFRRMAAVAKSFGPAAGHPDAGEKTSPA